MVNFVYRSDEGLSRESGLLPLAVLFICDMKVADDVLPLPVGGEAEQTTLLSIQQITAALGKTPISCIN